MARAAAHHLTVTSDASQPVRSVTIDGQVRAGAAARGAPPRSSRVGAVAFALADSSDDAAIRRLLRQNPMAGSINLTFEREPSYFAGAGLAGGEEQTIVARAGSEVVCIGRCSHRACWVDGEPRRVGYLAELRLDAAARGRFAIVRDGYRFFHELQSSDQTSIYFTAIAADNDRARRLLESSARGLPSYRFLAELDTLLVRVRRRARAERLVVTSATPEHLPAMLQMLQLRGRRHQLATVWTEEAVLCLAAHDLPLERFLLAFSGGELVACGALWDQRTFRQTVVRGYSRTLSAVRPLVNLASHFAGTARLPRLGSTIAHAFLSPLALANGAERMLDDFVGACFPLAAFMGLEFLTLALPTNDPRLPSLRRRFATRTWRSRLYAVQWPGEAPFRFADLDIPFLPELALL